MRHVFMPQSCAEYAGPDLRSLFSLDACEDAVDLWQPAYSVAGGGGPSLASLLPLSTAVRANAAGNTLGPLGAADELAAPVARP